jgi:hypothetical protein
VRNAGTGRNFIGHLHGIAQPGTHGGEEEKAQIMEFLFREFGQGLLRQSIAGLPEFYKNYLLEQSFEEQGGQDKHDAQ